MILDLQNILFRISATNFGKAITAFHKKQIPTSLALPYVKVSKEDMEHLSNLFSSNSYAELKGHYNDPAPALTFREASSIPTRIEKYVKYKITNYHCEKAAKQFLKYKSHITDLNLTSTHIEGRDIPSLVNLISSHKFTSVDLKQSLFTNKDAAELIKSLSNISYAITIDLSHSRYIDHGFVEAVLPCLKGAANAITIKLYRDNIQDGEYMQQNIVIKDSVLQYDPHLFDLHATLEDLQGSSEDNPDLLFATTDINWDEDNASLCGDYAQLV